MTTIYVAGPMSGLPEFNYPAFHEAARHLRAAGFVVVNPAEICPPGLDWAGCMRICIANLMKCDVVATLPGWQRSRGATVEVYNAEALGMSCRPVAAWLKFHQEAA